MVSSPVVALIEIPEIVGEIEYCKVPVPPDAEIVVRVSDLPCVVMMTESTMDSVIPELMMMKTLSSAVTPAESVTRIVRVYEPCVALVPIVTAPVRALIEKPAGVEASEKLFVPVPPVAEGTGKTRVNPAVVVSSAGAVMASALLTVKEMLFVSEKPN